MTESARDKTLKKQSFRNLLMLSISFQVVFTAFGALQNLQSSLNEKNGLGTVSLSVVYSGFIVSGVFAPVVIGAIGAKWTLVAGWVCHLIYTGSNFYPQWLTTLPAAILLGGLSGPLWTAQSFYLSQQAFMYSDVSKESPEKVLSRFNGIFFTLLGTTSITGNLISSFVLKHDKLEYSNQTSSNISICGALYCPTDINTTGVADPDHLKYTLIGIFSALDLTGLFITIVFLPPLKLKSSRGGSAILKSAMSCSKLLADTRMLLLVPLFLVSAMRQGFLWSEFTKSYITCALGVGMVGYIMAACGGSNAVFAFLSSGLAGYFGRYVMLVTACGLHMAALVTLLFWHPSDETIWIHFVLVIVWGLAEGIWLTQANGKYVYVEGV